MLDNLVIVGLGLLGGSIALDVRANKIAHCIIGVDKCVQTQNQALETNVVDCVLSLEKAGAIADVIILAVPVQQMLLTLTTMAPFIKKSTCISDVGSVKEFLYQQVKENIPQLLPQFVFAHPIAGAERSGIDAATKEMFVSKHMVLINTEEVTLDNLQVMQKFWEKLGAIIVQMSVQQHDSIFAKTSHLPHVMAFALMNYLNSAKKQAEPYDILQLAAAGFYDFTRIASSNAQMWRDICMSNAPAIKETIIGYQQELNRILHLIESKDEATLLTYFVDAKKTRDIQLTKKNTRDYNDGTL